MMMMRIIIIMVMMMMMMMRMMMRMLMMTVMSIMMMMMMMIYTPIHIYPNPYIPQSILYDIILLPNELSRRPNGRSRLFIRFNA